MTHKDRLVDAAECGDVELVAQLIGRINIAPEDMEDEDNEPLWIAARHGHVECVKLLLPVCDPKSEFSLALTWAAEQGHTECVKLLIPVSNPKIRGSMPLREAARGGHVECLKILLPHSDPKADNSGALRNAVYEQHKEAFLLLYPLIDPQDVMEHIQGKHARQRDKDALEFMATCVAEHEKNIICDNMPASPLLTKAKKI